MITRLENACDLLTCPKCANWHSVAHRFSQHYYVWLDLSVFKTKPFTCSCETSLNFINHQQDASVGAHLSRCLQIFDRSGHNASFALNRLKQNCGDCFIKCRLKRLDVIEHNMSETFGHRRKWLMLFWLTSCRQRSESTPVKTAECTYNDMLTSTTKLARQLDASLIGFSTRVTKEDLTVSSIFATGRT